MEKRNSKSKEEKGKHCTYGDEERKGNGDEEKDGKESHERLTIYVKRDKGSELWERHNEVGGGRRYREE